MNYIFSLLIVPVIGISVITAPVSAAADPAAQRHLRSEIRPTRPPRPTRIPRYLAQSETGTRQPVLTVTPTLTPVPALSADLSVTGEMVQSDGALQYLITMKNSGPDSAAGVTLTSVLPEGTSAYVSHIIKGVPGGCDVISQVMVCTFDTLPKDQSVRVDLAVRRLETANGTLKFSAAADSKTSDPDTGNNTASTMVSM